VLDKIRIARRVLVAGWFSDWNEPDKAQLLALLQSVC
jgi:hypothetical protein